MRFAVLARAALEFGARDGVRPGRRPRARLAGRARARLPEDACWPTGRRSAGPPAVFTIHNLAYQGLFPPAWMPVARSRLGAVRHRRRGVLGQAQFPEGGDQLQRDGDDGQPALREGDPDAGVRLRLRRDPPAQQPAAARHPERHRRRRLEPRRAIRTCRSPTARTRSSAKRASKRALLEAMGCRRPGRRSSGRSSGWCRAWWIRRASTWSTALGDGSARARRDVRRARQRRAALPGHVAARSRDRAPDRVACRFGFDERLAHLIEAGADIFLMPSRFEPCGLNQMYSLRYGTVPVVHAVGGLDDTVENWNPPDGRGHGLQVRGLHAGRASGRAAEGAGPLPQTRGVAGRPARRDGEGLLLGRVGRRVRRGVRDGDPGAKDGRAARLSNPGPRM